VSDADRIALWARDILNRRLRTWEQRQMTAAMIDVEFLDFAEPVRRGLGLDYIVGIAAERIAGAIKDRDGHTVHTDFFSSTDGRRVSLVSTFELRELARAANRTFEAAVAFVVIASVMTGLCPAIRFHEEDFHRDRQACLFDYNYDRRAIVQALRRPRVGPECLERVRPMYRRTVQALLETLDRLPRPAAEGGATG
jgi:hypothetical protein